MGLMLVSLASVLGPARHRSKGNNIHESMVIAKCVANEVALGYQEISTACSVDNDLCPFFFLKPRSL